MLIDNSILRLNKIFDNSLLKLYKKYSGTFTSHLRATKKRCDEEDIHQLRVSIKRLKALLKLIEMISSGAINTKLYYDMFSNIFDVTGKVREIQINLNLLQTFDIDIPKVYLDYLQENLHNYTEQMIDEVNKFDTKKLYRQNSRLYQKIQNLFDPLTLEKSVSYLSSNINKIFVLLDQEYQDIKLHKIRKHLRLIGEVLKVTYEINAQMKINELFPKLKEIRDDLGNWHDLDILSISVEEFSKKVDAYQDEFESLSDIIYLEKELLQIKIIDKLVNFYQNELPL